MMEYRERVEIQFYSTEDIIDFQSLAPLASFLENTGFTFGISNLNIYLEYVCPEEGDVFYNGSCIT